MFAFPCDWRIDVRAIAGRLRAFIDEAPDGEASEAGLHGKGLLHRLRHQVVAMEYVAADDRPLGQYLE